MGGADVIVAGTMGALLGFPNFFVAIFLSAAACNDPCTHMERKRRTVCTIFSLGHLHSVPL